MPPFAHFGVPQIVIMTSMPRSAAPRTSASRSLKLYAGSSHFAALFGFFAAIARQSAVVRMIEALAAAALSSSTVLLADQRNDGSSWKPMGMRSAPSASVGATSASSAATSAIRAKRCTDERPPWA